MVRTGIRAGLVLSLWGATLCAQSTFGVITGTVTDPSSAIIQGATVEAKSQTTSRVRTAVTGPDGVYQLVNLDPDSYTLNISAKGFAVSSRNDVQLPARETVRIDDEDDDGAALVARDAQARVGTTLADKYRLLRLIGVGGIASAEDAWARIRAGASLVQLYSAMVYEGPGIARAITTGLEALMARDGFASIAEAVGNE